MAEVGGGIVLRDWARAGGSALVETTRLAGRRIWAWLGIALLLAGAASACGGSSPVAASGPIKVVAGANISAPPPPPPAPHEPPHPNTPNTPQTAPPPNT